MAAKGASGIVGVISSLSSIPFIGPALAIAGAAAMAAVVGGYKSSIKSARGGYDIPSGYNPLVQTHEEEMILPKAQANVIRDLARGRSSNQDKPSSDNIHVTFNINTQDADSFRQSQSQIERDMATAVKSAKRGM